jgi:hypothetical protein
MFKPSRFLRCCLLLLGILFALSALYPSVVRGQSASQIKVSAPDLSKYPVVTFSFWPFDSEGRFVDNITTATLNVFENDKQVELDSLQLLEPGTHFILAINEAGTLGNSYAGEKRLDRMKQDWSDWAADQAITTMDDFTMLNNGGTLSDQLTKPAEWVDAIAAYDPDLEAAAPNFACLALALNKFSEITDSKTKTILLVTPLPSADQLAGLQEMAVRAVEADIHIFVWLVGPQSYGSDPGAQVLREMAASTKGAYFLFSDAEELPTLSSYLDPLRLEYVATYKTTLNTSGSYTLAVQVDQAGFQESSEKVSFDLTALPPNPIFLSPPASITRAWHQDANTKAWSLDPAEQTLQFMVEFPDGHTRALTSAALYVDGEVVAENTAEPFNEFTWDLSPYTQTGSHLLQVKVTDTAGLSATTIEMPVSIVVDEKPLGFIGRFVQRVGLQNLGVAIFLLLVAAGLVALFLRLRLRAPARRSTPREPLRQTIVSPETEPADLNREPRVTEEIPARLVALGSGECSLPDNTVFNLNVSGTLLGSDPVRCDIALDAPAVAPVHAEIFTDAAQTFHIADRGSAAGTWVNYAPVSSQGTRLANGDLIQIGSCEFRFEAAGSQGQPIRVEPYSE